MAKRYRVTLTVEERDALDRMISRGRADARKLTHARVLLQADASEGAEKGSVSPAAEQGHTLMTTDLEARDMLGKSSTFPAGADLARMILGACVPVILSSRADTERIRPACCAVAVLTARVQGTLPVVA